MFDGSSGPDQLAGAPLVAGLAGLDQGRLDPVAAVEVVVAAERAIAWLGSLQDAAIVAACGQFVGVAEAVVDDGRGRDRAILIEDGVREELASACRWTQGRADDAMCRARMLAGPLNATREAVAAGELSAAHVAHVVRHAQRLPGVLALLGGRATDTERGQATAACAQFEECVLPQALRGTSAQTRTACEEAVLAIDPEGDARRRSRARRLRDAFVSPDIDGNALLGVRMGLESAMACLARIDAVAHDDRFPSDCEATIGERRADAAAALILADSGARSTVPEPEVRTHLDITIDLDTLLGLQDAPAHLAGVGAVPADMVRDLLAGSGADVTMRRLVTDPLTGHLLDLGRERYAVPDRLRDFIVARDGTCRFPGCRRRAAACQVDHATAWDDGGDTSIANLGALCIRHHLLKTHCESWGGCSKWGARAPATSGRPRRWPR